MPAMLSARTRRASPAHAGGHALAIPAPSWRQTCLVPCTLCPDTSLETGMRDQFDAATFQKVVGPEVRWRQDGDWRVVDEQPGMLEMERTRSTLDVERVRLTPDASGSVVTSAVPQPKRAWRR